MTNLVIGILLGLVVGWLVWRLPVKYGREADGCRAPTSYAGRCERDADGYCARCHADAYP